VTFVQRAWWIGLLALAACGEVVESVPDAGSRGDDTGTHGPSPGVDAGGHDATFDATLDAASHDAPTETGLPDVTAQHDASDAGLPCPPYLHDCLGSCVSLSTDSTNCGSCGNACAPGAVCANGSCTCGAWGCPPGMMNCGPGCNCVNPMVDPNDCGACGNRCPAGQICSTGQCVPCDQPPNTVPCNGRCIDPNTDPTFCGASGFCGDPSGYRGTPCLFVPGTACVGGSCTPLDAASD
jgi:hypothetical protein